MTIRSPIRSPIKSAIRLATGGESGGGVPLTGDRYVSPTGNDSADGLTRETAWATFGKLSTWFNALAADSVATAVVMSGEYTSTTELALTNSNAITLTIDFEPGVTVDSTAAVVSVSGVRHYGSTAGSFTVNLRGAEFYGNNVGSANGLATGGAQKFFVNGAGPGGKLALFDGFDDGVSCHGTGLTVTDIVFSDCQFQNCTKGAFTHVNNAFATHRRCKFIGRASATLGVGADQSTKTSEFYDCEFTPATANQNCVPRHAVRCKIGTQSLRATGSNLSTTTLNFTDCFLNYNADGPGNWTWSRCYGFVTIRIRGTDAQVSSFDNCVFLGRTTADKFVSTTNGGTSWLGGSATFTDCIFSDYGDSAFDLFIGTAGEVQALADHMNANWDVNHCAFYNNTVNFDPLLTIGTDLVTDDPELINPTTTSQTDWAVDPTSPCVGAGVAGGNIGFTVDDLS